MHELGIVFHIIDTVPQGRTCPYCGSGDTHLLQGNACSIREIEAR